MSKRAKLGEPCPNCGGVILTKDNSAVTRRYGRICNRCANKAIQGNMRRL